ncbi:MAG TPA: Mut7-C RNAse domain-containing protein [Burkholderiales bacterium]|nr:Mut7-C RNAse domain-containing protein [Burkholderiales bacterium]
MARAAFRFHDELGAFLASARRERSFEHDCARAATLKHAIESLGVPHTEVGRLIVNSVPATLARLVRAGDAVEVFPHRPIHGSGDARPAFVADAHLGRLARLLRMVGFDTLYDNHYSDTVILETSARERRVILTRDRELLKCREVLRGGYVHARKPEDQLREVAVRFDLKRQARSFTLCLHCNLDLQPVDKAFVAERVPQRIALQYSTFRRCAGCERIFWQGTHWARMRDMLNTALDVPATVC